MTRSFPLAMLVMLATLASAQEPLPEVRIDRDDFPITKSCRIVPPSAAIHDANGDGVIHVLASDVTIEFDPAVVISGLFWGDPAAHPPDGYTGTGIRIVGQKHVRLIRPRLRGFRNGIHATRADSLVIEGADLADLFRQHLRSTPAAEDSSDWLWPHENDQNEWLTKYGAAIYVEDSTGVTIRNSKCRDGQNGILLDRVEKAQIYDNDFSFLSGWGLGMWRTTRSLVNRNAFDFCVRGYSHGVYNRGQDSAGILMFEQCSDNVLWENSATHCGDGVFGFAGKEALGETPKPSATFDYSRRGCNSNVFFANDFSYAPAHGIEMTFSFGNKILYNRLVGNAICGIWGGYSQDTLIFKNEIADNGGMGYGLERGGVNIEHGYRNVIQQNAFARNRCGVHLWWTDNKDFAAKPWGVANYRGCRENVIAGNDFDRDEVAIHLRAAKTTTLSENTTSNVGRELDADAESNLMRPDHVPAQKLVPLPPIGTKTPVGARPQLRGRENIVMTEWGPWDHESRLIQLQSDKGGIHRYLLRRFDRPAVVENRGNVPVKLDTSVSPPELVISGGPGVTPYDLFVADGGSEVAAPIRFPLSGSILRADWTVRVFPTSAKPHEDAAAWTRDSGSARPLPATLPAIDFQFGGRGPLDLPALAAAARPDAQPVPANHFGIVAETSVPLPAGKWRITTLSDDGVRVTASGKRIIDNWTWHVPTRDSAILDLPEPRTVPIRVEYFELDGHAVLTLEIERVAEPKK